MNIQGYAIVIESLPFEDGGGFIATVPDLPGCMSDGETPQTAWISDPVESFHQTTPSV